MNCVNKKTYKLVSLKSKDDLKISKKDMLQSFKILSSKKKYKLNDINNLNGDYGKGMLPTMLKICYYSNYIDKRQYLNTNILYSDKDLLVFKINKYIVISFKMSQDKNDWYNNLSLTRIKIYLKSKIFKEYNKWKKKSLDSVTFNDFKVHTGFFSFLKQNKYIKKIKTCIENSGIKNPFIIYTGQSRGGALATLSSLLIYNTFPNLKFSTITFASPPLFNKNASMFYLFLKQKEILINHYRVINSDDILTKLKTTDYIWKPVGHLRHVGSYIPSKFVKNIYDNRNTIKSGFIVIDNKHRFKNMFEKCSFINRRKFVHLYFLFSNKTNAVLFIT